MAIAPPGGGQLQAIRRRTGADEEEERGEVNVLPSPEPTEIPVGGPVISDMERYEEDLGMRQPDLPFAPSDMEEAKAQRERTRFGYEAPEIERLVHDEANPGVVRPDIASEWTDIVGVPADPAVVSVVNLAAHNSGLTRANVMYKGFDWKRILPEEIRGEVDRHLLVLQKMEERKEEEAGLTVEQAGEARFRSALTGETEVATTEPPDIEGIDLEPGEEDRSPVTARGEQEYRRVKSQSELTRFMVPYTVSGDGEQILAGQTWRTHGTYAGEQHPKWKPIRIRDFIPEASLTWIDQQLIDDIRDGKEPTEKRLAAIKALTRTLEGSAVVNVKTTKFYDSVGLVLDDTQKYLAREPGFISHYPGQGQFRYARPSGSGIIRGQRTHGNKLYHKGPWPIGFVPMAHPDDRKILDNAISLRNQLAIEASNRAVRKKEVKARAKGERDFSSILDGVAGNARMAWAMGEADPSVLTLREAQVGALGREQIKKLYPELKKRGFDDFDETLKGVLLPGDQSLLANNQVDFLTPDDFDYVSSPAGGRVIIKKDRYDSIRERARERMQSINNVLHQGTVADAMTEPESAGNVLAEAPPAALWGLEDTGEKTTQLSNVDRDLEKQANVKYGELAEKASEFLGYLFPKEQYVHEAITNQMVPEIDNAYGEFVPRLDPTQVPIAMGKTLPPPALAWPLLQAGFGIKTSEATAPISENDLRKQKLLFQYAVVHEMSQPATPERLKRLREKVGAPIDDESLAELYRSTQVRAIATGKLMLVDAHRAVEDRAGWWKNIDAPAEIRSKAFLALYSNADLVPAEKWHKLPDNIKYGPPRVGANMMLPVNDDLLRESVAFTKEAREQPAPSMRGYHMLYDSIDESVLNQIRGSVSAQWVPPMPLDRPTLHSLAKKGGFEQRRMEHALSLRANRAREMNVIIDNYTSNPVEADANHNTANLHLLSMAAIRSGQQRRRMQQLEGIVGAKDPEGLTIGNVLHSVGDMVYGLAVIGVKGLDYGITGIQTGGQKFAGWTMSYGDEWRPRILQLPARAAEGGEVVTIETPEGETIDEPAMLASEEPGDVLGNFTDIGDVPPGRFKDKKGRGYKLVVDPGPEGMGSPKWAKLSEERRKDILASPEKYYKGTPIDAKFAPGWGVAESGKGLPSWRKPTLGEAFTEEGAISYRKLLRAQAAIGPALDEMVDYYADLYGPLMRGDPGPLIEQLQISPVPVLLDGLTVGSFLKYKVPLAAGKPKPGLLQAPGRAIQGFGMMVDGYGAGAWGERAAIGRAGRVGPFGEQVAGRAFADIPAGLEVVSKGVDPVTGRAVRPGGGNFLGNALVYVGYTAEEAANFAAKLNPGPYFSAAKGRLIQHAASGDWLGSIASQLLYDGIHGQPARKIVVQQGKELIEINITSEVQRRNLVEGMARGQFSSKPFLSSILDTADEVFLKDVEPRPLTTQILVKDKDGKASSGTVSIDGFESAVNAISKEDQAALVAILEDIQAGKQVEPGSFHIRIEKSGTREKPGYITADLEDLNIVDKKGNPTARVAEAIKKEEAIADYKLNKFYYRKLEESPHVKGGLRKSELHLHAIPEIGPDGAIVRTRYYMRGELGEWDQMVSAQVMADIKHHIDNGGSPAAFARSGDKGPIAHFHPAKLDIDKPFELLKDPHLRQYTSEQIQKLSSNVFKSEEKLIERRAAIASETQPKKPVEPVALEGEHPFKLKRRQLEYIEEKNQWVTDTLYWFAEKNADDLIKAEGLARKFLEKNAPEMTEFFAGYPSTSRQVWRSQDAVPIYAEDMGLIHRVGETWQLTEAFDYHLTQKHPLALGYDVAASTVDAFVENFFAVLEMGQGPRVAANRNIGAVADGKPLQGISVHAFAGENTLTAKPGFNNERVLLSSLYNKMGLDGAVAYSTKLHPEAGGFVERMLGDAVEMRLTSKRLTSGKRGYISDAQNEGFAAFYWKKTGKPVTMRDIYNASRRMRVFSGKMTAMQDKLYRSMKTKRGRDRHAAELEARGIPAKPSERYHPDNVVSKVSTKKEVQAHMDAGRVFLPEAFFDKPHLLKHDGLTYHHFDVRVAAYDANKFTPVGGWKQNKIWSESRSFKKFEKLHSQDIMYDMTSHPLGKQFYSFADDPKLQAKLINVANELLQKPARTSGKAQYDAFKRMHPQQVRDPLKDAYSAADDKIIAEHFKRNPTAASRAVLQNLPRPIAEAFMEFARTGEIPLVAERAPRIMKTWERHGLVDLAADGRPVLTKFGMSTLLYNFKLSNNYWRTLFSRVFLRHQQHFTAKGVKPFYNVKQMLPAYWQNTHSLIQRVQDPILSTAYELAEHQALGLWDSSSAFMNAMSHEGLVFEGLFKTASEYANMESVKPLQGQAGVIVHKRHTAGLTMDELVELQLGAIGEDGPRVLMQMNPYEAAAWAKSAVMMRKASLKLAHQYMLDGHIAKGRWLGGRWVSPGAVADWVKFDFREYLGTARKFLRDNERPKFKTRPNEDPISLSARKQAHQDEMRVFDRAEAAAEQTGKLDELYNDSNVYGDLAGDGMFIRKTHAKRLGIIDDNDIFWNHNKSVQKMFHFEDAGQVFDSFGGVDAPLTAEQRAAIKDLTPSGKAAAARMPAGLIEQAARGAKWINSTWMMNWFKRQKLHGALWGPSSRNVISNTLFTGLMKPEYLFDPLWYEGIAEFKKGLGQGKVRTAFDQHALEWGIADGGYGAEFRAANAGYADDMLMPEHVVDDFMREPIERAKRHKQQYVMASEAAVAGDILSLGAIDIGNAMVDAVERMHVVSAAKNIKAGKPGALRFQRDNLHVVNSRAGAQPQSVTFKEGFGYVSGTRLPPKGKRRILREWFHTEESNRALKYFAKEFGNTDDMFKYADAYVQWRRNKTEGFNLRTEIYQRWPNYAEASPLTRAYTGYAPFGTFTVKYFNILAHFMTKYPARAMLINHLSDALLALDMSEPGTLESWLRMSKYKKRRSLHTPLGWLDMQSTGVLDAKFDESIVRSNPVVSSLSAIVGAAARQYGRPNDISTFSPEWWAMAVEELTEQFWGAAQINVPGTIINGLLNLMAPSRFSTGEGEITDSAARYFLESIAGGNIWKSVIGELIDREDDGIDKSEILNVLIGKGLLGASFVQKKDVLPSDIDPIAFAMEGGKGRLKGAEKGLRSAERKEARRSSVFNRLQVAKQQGKINDSVLAKAYDVLGIKPEHVRRIMLANRIYMKNVKSGLQPPPSPEEVAESVRFAKALSMLEEREKEIIKRLKKQLRR